MKKTAITVLSLVVLLWSLNTQAAGRSGKQKNSSFKRHTGSQRQSSHDNKFSRKRKSEKTAESDNKSKRTDRKPTPEDSRKSTTRRKRSDRTENSDSGKRKVRSKRKTDNNKAVPDSKSRGRRNFPAEDEDIVKNKLKDSDRAGNAKGKEHKQQSEAVKKQLKHEEEKHHERVARLERMRQLAEKEGDTKKVERIDKLIGKEQQRYESKLQKTVSNQDRIESKTEGSEDKVHKGEGKDED